MVRCWEFHTPTLLVILLSAETADSWKRAEGGGIFVHIPSGNGGSVDFYRLKKDNACPLSELVTRQEFGWAICEKFNQGKDKYIRKSVFQPARERHPDTPQGDKWKMTRQAIFHLNCKGFKISHKYLAAVTLVRTMQGIQLYKTINSVPFKPTEEPWSRTDYHFQADDSFQVNLLNQLKL